MPIRPSLPCSVCQRIDCTLHVKRVPFAGARRTSNLYNGNRWTQTSKAFLEGKRCADCGTTVRLQTDHDPPHDGTEATFYDRSRFIARCLRCHARKTARTVNAKRYAKAVA